MKKGISVELVSDSSGMHYRVRKERGKLTLDDIRDTMKEYEEDYYALIIKCMDDDYAGYFDDDIPEGDIADLYRAEDFLERSGRVKEK